MNKNLLIGFLLVCLVAAGFFIVNEKKSSTVIDADPVLPVEVFESATQDDSTSRDSTVTAVETVTNSPIAMYKKIVFGRDLPLKLAPSDFDQTREYEIKGIQRIHSADGIVDDVVFKGCVPYVIDPREMGTGEGLGFMGYEEDGYRCWNFAINDVEVAVYLEGYGIKIVEDDNDKGYSVTFSYNLNHYPYIYSDIEHSFPVGSIVYSGLDINTYQKKTLALVENKRILNTTCIPHGGGAGDYTDEKGFFLIVDERTDTAKGLFIQECHSVPNAGEAGSASFITVSSVEKVAIPPAEAAMWWSSKIPLEQTNLKAKALLKKEYNSRNEEVDSEFSESLNEVLISVGDQKYLYSFTSDSLQESN